MVPICLDAVKWCCYVCLSMHVSLYICVHMVVWRFKWMEPEGGQCVTVTDL